MSRWEPNARGRLQQAAMELYAERGFDSTTVVEIAGRAGLTERTFFRYFADKREVLFWGAKELEASLVAQVEAGPGGPPLGVVVGAFVHAADFFEGRREQARQRQAVIASSPELRERELIKLASLGAALADALRRRGVTEPGATLAAEAGLAVFRVAFERWVGGAGDQPLAKLLEDTADRLADLTSERV
ncbi:MAG TPA: TetR family transcriptional regulator [Acidimicrobiales bacterium]|nr:TetR family transcriptional regulator [Acidimicrobiales bacterium]